MDVEKTLRELIDREAIRDLVRRYAHHVWQGQPRECAALFSEDAEMDTGDRPPIRGRAALQAAYEEIFVGAALRPFVHNHVIELDGDRATGVCYLDLHGSIGGRSVTGTGHYEDEYVREGARWLFRSRKLSMAAPDESGPGAPEDSGRSSG